MARAQIEVWWVSGDGVGGPWWVGITGTSDNEPGALLSFSLVQKFCSFWRICRSLLLITFICVISPISDDPAIRSCF